MSSTQVSCQTKTEECNPEFKEFCEALYTHLKGVFPEGTQIEYLTLSKNNGINLHSLCIRKAEKAYGPAIHLEPYYQAYRTGYTLEDIVESIFEECKKDINFEFSNFLDYEWAKKRLEFKLVNFEKNREMLETVPYIPFFDLAVVAILDMKEVIGRPSSTLVHNRHMEMWNVTKKQLIKDAMENAPWRNPAKLQAMGDVLGELTDGADAEDGEVPMYVLSNLSKSFGAGCILYKGTLRSCAKELGKELYILPSSVHEMILVPADMVANPTELIHIVRDINRTQVLPTEVLSDQIYKYDMDRNTMSLLDIEKDFQGLEKAVIRTSIHLEDVARCSYRIAGSVEE